MDIIFIVGSLEYGRDGVGDYSRRLAAQFIKQGHHVGLLSLNDRGTTFGESTQHLDNVEIPVLRLSLSLPDKQRYTLASQWIDKLNPEYISLQFVPFAFHKKGLSLNLHFKLKKLGKGRKWHIMFHELWVGMDTRSSLKMKLWGRIQRYLIAKLVYNLKPVIINTNILLYQKQLASMKINSTVLPLFSNINVADKAHLVKRDDSFRNSISFVVFGNIHKADCIEDFAMEASELSKIGPKIELVFIGRCGKEQLAWRDAWLKEGMNVIEMGEQPENVVSEILTKSTMGIATTPTSLIGKSGVVAAMLQHRLPVINISRSWETEILMDSELPDGVFEYRKGNLALLLNTSKVNHSSDVETVAALLLKNFKN